MNPDEQPAGLSLSLDDLIKQEESSRRNYGPDRRRNDRYNNNNNNFRSQHQNNKAANNWICNACNFENFAYRKSCRQCGHSGPVHNRLGQDFRGGNFHNRPTHDYRENQQCFVEETTGTVVFKFHNSEIVRITPQGDITLNTDQHFGPKTFASLNDALNPLGIKITTNANTNITDGDWKISYGKSLIRFSDGVVLPAKGAMHIGRGQEMLNAFQNPLANAAKRASSDAAMRAGLMTPYNVMPQQGFGMMAAPQGMWMGGGGGGRGRGRGRGARYAPY